MLRRSAHRLWQRAAYAVRGGPSVVSRRALPEPRWQSRVCTVPLAVFALTVLAMPGLSSARDDSPPDPGADTDWLAWAWIDLGKGSRQEVLVDLAGDALRRIVDQTPVADAADRLVLDAAIDCARAGCPTGIWLVRAENTDPLRLRARIWKGELAEDLLRPFTAGRGPNQTRLWIYPAPEKGVVDIWPNEKSPTRPEDGNPTLSNEALHEWPSHRAAALGSLGADSSGSIELAINLNAIRIALGDAFDAGPAAKLLQAAHLANARVVGLHGRITAPDRVATRDPSVPKLGNAAKYDGPALLTLAATWTARSEPPGHPRVWPLTTLHWPIQQLGQPPTPAETPLIAAARVQWRRVVPAALDFYAATRSSEAATTFAVDRAAWLRESGPSADRLASGLEPWMTLWLAKEASEPVVHWRVGLRDGTTAGSAAALLGKALGAAKPSVNGDALEGASVRPGEAWKSLSLRFKLQEGRTASEGKPAEGARVEGALSLHEP